MRYGFLIEWTLEDSPKSVFLFGYQEKEEDSRRWREPNPLSIRHVWLYMKRVDERQFEWYRDNKNLLPPQNIISEAVFCCISVPRYAFPSHLVSES